MEFYFLPNSKKVILKEENLIFSSLNEEWWVKGEKRGVKGGTDVARL